MMGPSLTGIKGIFFFGNAAGVVTAPLNIVGCNLEQQSEKEIGTFTSRFLQYTAGAVSSMVLSSMALLAFFGSNAPSAIPIAIGLITFLTPLIISHFKSDNPEAMESFEKSALCAVKVMNIAASAISIPFTVSLFGLPLAVLPLASSVYSAYTLFRQYYLLPPQYTLHTHSSVREASNTSVQNGPTPHSSMRARVSIISSSCASAGEATIFSRNFVDTTQLLTGSQLKKPTAISPK